MQRPGKSLGSSQQMQLSPWNKPKEEQPVTAVCTETGSIPQNSGARGPASDMDSPQQHCGRDCTLETRHLASQRGCVAASIYHTASKKKKNQPH